MHINCDHNECLIASTVFWRPAELGVQERRHTHTLRNAFFFFFFLLLLLFFGEFSDWFVRESNKRKWLDRWSVSAISCWGLFFICAHQSSNGQPLSFLPRSLCSVLFFSFLFFFDFVSILYCSSHSPNIGGGGVSKRLHYTHTSTNSDSPLIDFRSRTQLSLMNVTPLLLLLFLLLFWLG